jgi:hypothetical protein
MKTFSSTIRHRNGGFEQAILEAVKETQGLDADDQARLDHLKSLPQNRTEINQTYTVMEKHDMGQEAKRRFAAYLLTLGYKVIPGTMQEGRTGVSAQISHTGSPDKANFTEVTRINPIKWYVRLAVKDYNNLEITEGKF